MDTDSALLQTLTEPSDSDPCPWGEGLVCLDGRQLAVTEKRWLGRQIVARICSPKQLCRLYGLNRKLMNKYGSSMRKGRRLCEHGGRPRLLDEIAEAHVRNQLLGLGHVSNTLFNHLINEAYVDTVRRRSDSPNYDVLPPLSPRSLKRYRLKLQMDT